MIDHVLDTAAILVGHALCGYPTVAATVELTRCVLDDGIPGDLVECGVFKGVHPALMAKVLEERHDEQRLVWLFDSFQGLPEPGPQDTTWPGLGERPGVERNGRLAPTGIAAMDLHDVKRFMQRWNVDERRLIYVSGWFQHTMSGSVQLPPQIALLRLDGDLYDSTRTCLAALYPKLAPGGVCIVDDWGLDGSRLAVLEYFDGEPEGLTVIEDAHRPVWWRKT